ncbi:Flagellin (modular protein) [Azospirillaceae bacterium]
MTANVALIGGMHETLRLLTKTADQIAIQTDHLATGQKINSALDGAAYFTAIELTHKSQDLVQRKDDMFQAIQTVKAAQTATSTISDLLEQARGLAKAAEALDNTPPAYATRRAYAAQFDSVVKQINDVAESSGFMNHNVALTDRRQTITQSTLPTGMGNADVFTKNGFTDYSLSVRGDGLISFNEQDAYEVEQKLGVSNLAATGFHTSSAGNFSDIAITVSGKSGGARSVSVSEGGESVTMSFTLADLQTRAQHFSGSFASGAKVDFDLDLAKLDEAAAGGESVLSASLTKKVNVKTIVRDAVTQEEQVRDGLSSDNRIINGENTFRFSQSALRLRMDQSRIMSAAAISGPVVSSVYGAGAQAVVGAPTLLGAPSSNVADHTYHIDIQGSGADTATMTSNTLQNNVSPVAQVDAYTTSGLANGETAALTINGSGFSVTAGVGGLTATAVRDALGAQVSGAGLPVSFSATAANQFTVTATSPGTAFTSSTSGSTPGALSDSNIIGNVSAVAQVNRVTLSSVVEIGETYTIGVNGTNYSYMSASGDTAASVRTHLVGLVAADASVTASAVGSDSLDITATTPGTAFTQTANVTNLTFHAEVTLSNGSASDTQIVTNPSNFTSVTFTAAYGDGITGVQMTMDPAKLGKDLLLNRTHADFDVRFSQTGDGDGRVASNMTLDGSGTVPYEVRFDGGPTDSLSIQSNDLRAAGLGLDRAANQWRDKSDVEASLNQCAKAIDAVRAAASSYNSTLGILQTRNAFAGDFSNVLEEGAAKLTQVDQNEASASLLMLQTRRQLGVISLSLANQAQQSILRLF